MVKDLHENAYSIQSRADSINNEIIEAKARSWVAYSWPYHSQFLVPGDRLIFYNNSRDTYEKLADLLSV